MEVFVFTWVPLDETKVPAVGAVFKRAFANGGAGFVNGEVTPSVRRRGGIKTGFFYAV